MTNEEQREIRTLGEKTTLVWASSTQGTFIDPKRDERRFAKLWIRRHKENKPSLSEKETIFRASL